MAGFVGSPKPGSARAAIEAMAQRIRATGPAGGPLVLADGVESLVPFGVESYSNGIDHDNVVNNDEFTITVAGYYLIVVVLQFEISNVTPAPATGVSTRINVDASLTVVNNFLGQYAADDIVEARPVSDIVECSVGSVITIGALANFADGAISMTSGVVAIHRLS